MKETKIDHNLVALRQDALNQHTHGLMRPHGKLWGMDVFSWMNPEITTIIDTIHAFPFKVLLVTPSSLLYDILQNDHQIVGNLHASIVYDTDVKTQNKSLDFLDNQFYETDMQQVWQQINKWQQKHTVLLFCAEGIDAPQFDKTFSNFLEIHQIK